MTQKENIGGAAHALADAERYLSRARAGHMAYVTAVLGAQQVALRAMLTELTELSHQAIDAVLLDAAAAQDRREMVGGPAAATIDGGDVRAAIATVRIHCIDLDGTLDEATLTKAIIDKLIDQDLIVRDDAHARVGGVAVADVKWQTAP